MVHERDIWFRMFYKNNSDQPDGKTELLHDGSPSAEGQAATRRAKLLHGGHAGVRKRTKDIAEIMRKQIRSGLRRARSGSTGEHRWGYVRVR